MAISHPAVYAAAFRPSWAVTPPKRLSVASPTLLVCRCLLLRRGVGGGGSSGGVGEGDRVRFVVVVECERPRDEDRGRDDEAVVVLRVVVEVGGRGAGGGRWTRLVEGCECPGGWVEDPVFCRGRSEMVVSL